MGVFTLPPPFAYRNRTKKPISHAGLTRDRPPRCDSEVSKANTKTMSPIYPMATWECGCCGKTNPGDLGFCPSCVDGHLERGGLETGSIPYFPVWHVKEAGYNVHDGHLPTPDKYPHHNRRVRP